MDKRYDKWAQVIRLLPRPVAISGDDKAYEPWMDQFKSDAGVQNLIGDDKKLSDVIPLFSRTKVILCPDNGLGHLAGLFGIPTVSVFNGVTNPKMTAPPEALVIEGMNSTLKPEDIVDQMHRLISENKA